MDMASSVKIQKTGGRKKGSENIVTRDCRAMVHEMIEKLHKRLSEDMETLSPKERVELYAKLLPYVCPKAVDRTAEGAEEARQIQVKCASIIESAKIMINREK